MCSSSLSAGRYPFSSLSLSSLLRAILLCSFKDRSFVNFRGVEEEEGGQEDEGERESGGRETGVVLVLFV